MYGDFASHALNGTNQMHAKCEFCRDPRCVLELFWKYSRDL